MDCIPFSTDSIGTAPTPGTSRYEKLKVYVCENEENDDIS